jgi:hypothetical protein
MSMRNRNGKVLSAAFLALMMTGWSGFALADRCKDVTIKVDNDFTHDGSTPQIRVVDFDYFDNGEGKWREENWVGNVVINENEGAKTITTRNLEYVGDEGGVILRVQYQYMTAKNGWSERLNAQSSSFFCKKDGPNSVTVTVQGI